MRRSLQPRDVGSNKCSLDSEDEMAKYAESGLKPMRNVFMRGFRVIGSCTPTQNESGRRIPQA